VSDLAYCWYQCGVWFPGDRLGDGLQTLAPVGVLVVACGELSQIARELCAALWPLEDLHQMQGRYVVSPSNERKRQYGHWQDYVQTREIFPDVDALAGFRPSRDELHKLASAVSNDF